MKRHLYLVLIAGLTLSITACKEGEKSKEDKNVTDKKGDESSKENKKVSSEGFSVSTPDGWTRKDTTMMGAKAVFLMSELEGPKDLFKQNINILSEKIGGMSFPDYISLSLSNMNKMLTNYESKSEKTITVDGVEAKSIDYSHSMSGYNIDVNAVMLVKDGTAYIITSSDEKGKLERWRKIIDETVASFHVN
jgi:hypothetical protein